MQENRLPKQLFYSELSEGHRSRGRPKLRFKDTLKKSLQKCSIDSIHWENVAKNRPQWRKAIHKGADAYEAARQGCVVAKRAARKSKKDNDFPIKCMMCGRPCASEFGLQSHMRVHK